MKLNPAHWGQPSMPCTLWMSPKGKVPIGNTRTEASAARSRTGSVPSGASVHAQIADPQSVQSPAECAPHFISPWRQEELLPSWRKSTADPPWDPPQMHSKQHEPLAFGSLGAGKQHRSPRLLSRWWVHLQPEVQVPSRRSCLTIQRRKLCG